MSELLNNRYRTLRVLGSGGCSRTFLAEDTHMPSNRRCVIKQLKPATDDPRAYQIIKERFQREAAILEKLGRSSNQIPTLHAYFTEDREFYLVQDWIDGRSLVQFVNEDGVFSEASVKRFLVDLLPILGYVHSQGIIHRDIKPENVMIRTADGKPVLIDFGAVKEVMTDSATTIIIGSPGFMAPEQANGKPVFSSDLYSLGLTAAYLLSGKRPQDLLEMSEGGVLWQRSLQISDSCLNAVLTKATKLLAHERYQRAEDMLQALLYAEHDTVPAELDDETFVDTRDEKVPQQRIRTVRSSYGPWLLAAVLLLTLGLVAVTAISLYQRRPSLSGSTPTPTPGGNTSTTAEFEVTVTHDLFTSVRAAPRSSSPEIRRLDPGTQIACDRTTVKGETLWDNNEWRYCPSVGGYIHSTLLRPVN